jgi:glutamate racemase
VYRYTKSCVEWFFKQGCPLVILACNTASAKALRTIQQQDLLHVEPFRRVLGVIRPTAEIIGTFSKSGHIGVLATPGTVTSQSYVIEIAKFFPDVTVHQQACPLWVPLIENNEYDTPGAEYFIKAGIDNLMQQDSLIDAVLLGCTHYPVLEATIRKYLPSEVRIISQGDIVAQSLKDYLRRHSDMAQRLSQGGLRQFYTTDNPTDFDAHAPLFFDGQISSQHADIGSA